MPTHWPDLLGIKTQKVIIQPTSFCNINCRYCYLPDRLSTKRIDTHTLSRIFDRIFSSSLISDSVEIVWHAGEPMTLPIRFYDEALQLIEQHNIRKIPVIVTFQTNGTRITQQWCDFINEHHVRISISLDGPQYIHDANRVDRAGKGTFERIIRNVELLQKNGVNPTILVVLTRQVLDHPDAIWQFFIEHRIKSLVFLIEEALGTCEDIPLNTLGDMNRYIQFLQRILELRDTCENPPFVREIDLLIDRIKYLTHPVRAQANTPMAVISFDCAGNMSTLSPELLTLNNPHYENFIFGNVFENSLEDMLSNQKFIDINTEVQAGVTRCKETCDYFIFCGGGSPANKLSENGTFNSTETTHCKLKIKATTDVILAHLEKQYQEKGI